MGTSTPKSATAPAISGRSKRHCVRVLEADAVALSIPGVYRTVGPEPVTTTEAGSVRSAKGCCARSVKIGRVADGAGPLSHIDDRGAAQMVDVTEKGATKRTAVAAGSLRTSAQVVELISGGGLAKGDALATARVAGIQAAKRTSDLIPLCHHLALTAVDVDFTVGESDIDIT